MYMLSSSGPSTPSTSTPSTPTLSSAQPLFEEEEVQEDSSITV